MQRTILLLGCFFVAATSMAARAEAVPADPHDPHELTPAELATFLPLMCKTATEIPHAPAGYNYHCDSIIGYVDGRNQPPNIRPHTEEISFTSILFGPITAAGRDEAYVSYHANFESHATLNGGGILFSRENGVWRLKHWYPAKQRGLGCLALPETAPLEMLCFEGDGHYDSSYEAVTVLAADPERNQSALSYTLAQPFMAVRDNEIGQGGDQSCAAEHAQRTEHPTDMRDPCSYWKPGKGFLLALDAPHRSYPPAPLDWVGLQRSAQPGAFAETLAMYATPEDVAAVCHAGCFSHAKWNTAIVHFTLHGHRIDTDLPIDAQPYAVGP
jgi:hypothetical protein